MIKYDKMFALLKEKGYNPSRVKREGILSQSTIDRIKKGEGGLAHININMLCTILHCQPSDLMEFVYDEKEEQEYLQKIEDFKNGIRKDKSSRICG